jgi:hypothetical protein
MLLLEFILRSETHHDTPGVYIFFIWVLPECHNQLQIGEAKARDGLEGIG